MDLFTSQNQSFKLNHSPFLNYLSQKNIWVGTSSWKYEGWKNIVYLNSYSSKKEFEKTCLTEYSSTFNLVGVDFSFYNPPTPAQFEELILTSKPETKFCFKVHESITTFHYPSIPRLGTLSGTLNQSFFDAEHFVQFVFNPLLTFRQKRSIGPLLFEITPGTQNDQVSLEYLKEKIRHFTLILKSKNLFEPGLFAIEIRNKSWANTSFYSFLKEMEWIPILNSWTRMLPIEDQWHLVKEFDFKELVIRPTQKPGTSFEWAEVNFEPYSEIKRPVLATRKTIQEVLDWCSSKEERKLHLLMNNHLEGSAPLSIQAVLNPALEFFETHPQSREHLRFLKPTVN
jgi:uncharacterized protein YecE (DUF72 family)